MKKSDIKKANIEKILEKYGNDSDILQLIDERAALYRFINRNKQLDLKTRNKLEDMLNYLSSYRNEYYVD